MQKTRELLYYEIKEYNIHIQMKDATCSCYLKYSINHKVKCFFISNFHSDAMASEKETRAMRSMN